MSQGPAVSFAEEDVLKLGIGFAYTTVAMPDASITPDAGFMRTREPAWVGDHGIR